MKTDKITVDDIFDKPRRYLIPLFQRGYVWTREDQWAPLWADILYQVKLLRDQEGATSQTPRKHFLGAVVLNQATLGVRHTPTSDVIDGQQRLTTLQVLLVAFRDVALTIDNEFLQAKLKRLTENPGPWPEDDERFKIWPTSSFRTDFRTLAVAGSRDLVLKAFPQEYLGRKKWTPRPQLVEAYLYFYDAIERLVRTGALTPAEASDAEAEEVFIEPLVPGLEAAEYLLRALTSSLQLIEISLDGEDDAQIIFETLNARGAPLQASDLIRNFVFLYATRRKEDVLDLYESSWRDFDEEPDDTPRSKTKRFWKEEERQGRLKSPRLDLFFYHFITFRTGHDLKIAHIFQEFRDWWERSQPPRNAKEELTALKRSALTFKALLRPDSKTHFGRFAATLKLLDNTTVYPLLLFVRDQESTMGAADAQKIVVDLESYLVRRAVCGMTAKNYNRIFLQLLRALRQAGPSHAEFRRLLLELGGESSMWPDDATFEKHFVTNPIYTLLGPPRTRMILQSLEKNLHGPKQEGVSFDGVLTVEHVWPQSPKEGTWPPNILRTTDGALDFDAMAQRDRLRHSIGNLTLVTSAFNSSLSNQSYLEKQPAITRESLLLLNAYFQDVPRESGWDAEKIRTRASKLFQTARATWPYPSAS